MLLVSWRRHSWHQLSCANHHPWNLRLWVLDNTWRQILLTRSSIVSRPFLLSRSYY